MKDISRVADLFFRKRLPILAIGLNEVAQQIESFWAITMQRHHFFDYMFTDREWDILFEYLNDVEVVALTGYPKAYRLVFRFAENPYFENPTLEKDLIYAEEPELQTERIRVVCYPIIWKQGQNAVEKSKPDSFFAWFDNQNSDWGETFIEDLYPNALNYYRGIYEVTDEEEENGAEEGEDYDFDDMPDEEDSENEDD